MEEMCDKYLFRNTKICLTIIIIMQMCMIFYVANQKQGYHIDEIYSYILSNSYDADKISTADWMWGNWIEGKEFDQFITVQEGEGFSYQTVYLNNSTDCHPPLFYWLLHTVCSFFPNQFSKWLGIGINMVFFVVTCIFIYLISDELIKVQAYKLLPVILYGFSKFAVDTCMYIRMYMLLTMFATIFVYIHIHMYRKGVNAVKICSSMITIYLGAMTQYYFLIFSFWGVLLFAVYLLRRKQIKEMFTYGIGACISVGLMMLSYPYVITQATGSSTNNVGNEVARHLFDFKLWIQMSYSLIKQTIAAISYHRWISLAIAGIVLFMFAFMAIKKRGNLHVKSSPETVWITGIIVCIFFSVSFIGGEFVYLRYIYFIMPLFYIDAITVFEKISSGDKRLHAGVMAVCVIFAVLNAVFGAAEKKASYLMLNNAASIRQMGMYSNDKMIVIASRPSAAISTGNLMTLRQFSSVYMDTKDHISSNHVLQDSIKDDGECVVLIETDTYWLNGFDAEQVLQELIAQDGNLKYSFIVDGGLGDYYRITKKN